MLVMFRAICNVLGVSKTEHSVHLYCYHYLEHEINKVRCCGGLKEFICIFTELEMVINH